MTKKIGFVLTILTCVLMGISCEMSAPDKKPPAPPPEGEGETLWDADKIATWTTMVTPQNDAKGNAKKSGEYAVITTLQQGWGGVQSPEFELEYNKEPAFSIDIQLIDSKWGVRFVPSSKATGDNGWGFSLVGDDDDNSIGLHPYPKMGKMNDPNANENKNYNTLYPAAKVKGRLWVYAIGAPNASVTVKSIKIYYPDEE